MYFILFIYYFIKNIALIKYNILLLLLDLRLERLGLLLTNKRIIIIIIILNQKTLLVDFCTLIIIIGVWKRSTRNIHIFVLPRIQTE